MSADGTGGEPARGRVRESPARAAGLFALFALGQVAALRLTDVRPYAVFQHYLPWSDAVEAEGPALAVLVLQTLVCVALAGVAPIVVALRGGYRRLGRWRSLVAVAILGAAVSVPTESIARSAGEAFFAVWVWSAAILNLVLAVRAIPSDALTRLRERLAGVVTLSSRGDGPRRWDGRLPWFAAGAATLVAALMAWFAFEGVPHIDDSVAYLFQAKCLAAGEFHVPPAPDAESFAATHFIRDADRWYGKFFPGWPAVLALGVLADLEWLVNPVLGGVGILLAHALVRRIYDRRTANGTALLLAASPWVLGLSAEMMAHAVSLVWMLLAYLAIEIQRERGASGWSLVAGGALGALFLTRPFDAALVGPVAALMALGLGGKRLSFAALAITGAVAAAVASLYFAYNAAVTGDPSATPHSLWADAIFGPGVDVFGFGKDVGIPMWRNMDPLPGHGAADVVLNANKNAVLISFELFGWATGSLPLAAIGLLRRRAARGDGPMLWTCLAVVGGHSVYWAPGGPDFGARYWYLIVVPLVVFTLRGVETLSGWLRPPEGPAPHGTRVGVAVAVASALALVVVVPWRCVTKYHRYREIGADARTLAPAHGLDGALVFVRATRRSDYQAAFSFNSPRLDGPGPVYALDTGPEGRSTVVRAYPGRPVFVIGRPADGTAKLVLLEGPLPPGTVPDGTTGAYERSLQADLAALRKGRP